MNKKFLPLIALIPALTALSCSGNANDEPPAPDPVKLPKKYLPKKITEYSSQSDKIVDTIEYEYDDDYLGYKQTRTIDNGSEPWRTVNIYRYNQTFDKLTLISEDYGYEDGGFKIYSRAKYEYSYLDNGSYSLSQYDYDFETNQYAFYKDVYREYNSKGNMTLEYTKYYDDELKEKYYSDYTTYKYDEQGFEIECVVSNPNDEGELIPDYIEVTEYDSSEHKHGVEKDYVVNKNGERELDSYTDINITYEDGIRKHDEQNYYPDDSKGNHNVFWYNQNNVLIYINYGGMNEESSISLNEYNQINYYYYRSGDELSSELLCEYEPNGGLLIKTTYDSISKYFTDNVICNYSYTEDDQLIKATATCKAVEYKEESEPVNIEINYETKIEYTDVKNNELFYRLDYEGDVYASYSSYILKKGETLY